jgi:hypothetical protein
MPGRSPSVRRPQGNPQEGSGVTMTDRQPEAEAQPDEPQLWKTLPPLPDEVVEKLRRLIFGQHTAPEND